MPIEKLKLPKGRIVGGHPVRSEDKENYQTGKKELDDAGQVKQQWRVEYAIPKAEFLTHVYPLMQQEALSAFPNWQTIMDAQTGLPLDSCDFSWKVIDGDSPKPPKTRPGKKPSAAYNTREGYPGHFILTLKTEAFAPGCVVFKNGAYHNVEENQVKAGDYVIANVDIKVHTNNDGGLYINPNGFELVEIGQPISTGGGGNPETLFGDASARTGGFQGQLPQAGLARPVAAPVPGTYPQQAPSPQYQSPPVNAAVPGAYPAPAATPQYGTVPNAPPPAYDLVQTAMTGQPQAQVPQAYAATAAPLPVAHSASPATPSNFNPATGIPGLPPQR